MQNITSTSTAPLTVDALLDEVDRVLADAEDQDAPVPYWPAV